MLISYGDTVPKVNCESIERVAHGLKELNAADMSLFSVKHQALYGYLYRLLMPVWELNITASSTFKAIRN